MRELEPLSFALSDLPPTETARRVIESGRDLAQEMAARRGEARIPGLVTSDGRVAWQFLNAGRELSGEPGGRFCEWGSGIGVVSCLASLLDWQVIGLEIEPRLVELARENAAQQACNPEFHIGSYKPDNMDDPTAKPEDFDTGLGFGLFDFDVIYAYPWPAEKELITRFIGANAKPGTLFLRYGGGLDCKAFRVEA